MRQQKGFSLVELMVTIGVLGVLAAIAVQTYDAFQQHARVASAKSNLAVLYEFETGFQSDYGSFTSRLDALGFDLAGDLNWTLGFPGYVGDLPPPPDAPQGSSRCSRTCYDGAAPNTFCIHNPTWRCTSLASSAGFSSNHPAAEVTANTFTAEAHVHPYGTPEFAISVYFSHSKVVIVDFDAN